MVRKVKQKSQGKRKEGKGKSEEGKEEKPNCSTLNPNIRPFISN